MTIIGGTYLEESIYDHWRELYGSGWRAVKTLSPFVEKIKFCTYIDKKYLSILEYDPLVSNDSVELDIKEIDKTLSFKYFNTLSTPKITPSLIDLNNTKNEMFNISDDVVLRFGLLEGDVKVNSKKVVYDPQSSHSPKSYFENGSNADELLMVLNLNEAKLLSGKNNIEDMKDSLLEKNTVAVIVKLGPLGGAIITNEGIEYYPAYRTDNVFSIGTGDVFATMLCYYWAVKNETIKKSVENASKAVSVYSSTKSLYIQDNFLENKFNDLPTYDNIKNKEKHIYIAGPFFNMQQRWLIEEIRNNLMGYNIEIFSPFHDIGRGLASEVVHRDIEGINQSKVVLATLDGLDSGTIFEIGYARAKNIPVVIYVENESVEDLKMMEGTECDIESNYTTAIYKAIWYALEN
ncbi:hypothetical protein AF80_06430 [Aliarcobacter butzleri L355]|uniref:Carbohydrate kinase PfkB domain-containing protein n=1 Tax=Aliarcobacter butzleri L355 TaxID=1447263 RepID=A0A0G9KS92_9BACT|nr:PfkB family carbohydrate kinase [Aliarcobacter butzleri]KLE09439.1 hypothetical protein AF80_06430 [Aliarcobacter butzleri L355]BAK71722.1 nucleoside 2-deoxyribosyltransferase [Aliarcobacter butzleri ED-1]